jgi:ketosteroid isomerase-like protein
MKAGMFVRAVAMLAFAGTAISVAQKPNPNPDEQAIRKLDKDWSAAARSKDVDKTVSFYADEASALPFNAPIANGKDQIRQVWAHLTSLPGFALSFGPTKIEVAKSGDLAYDLGTFELKTNDAQGNSTTEVGKYTVVWKKQPDKQWKAVVDMFNTDK